MSGRLGCSGSVLQSLTACMQAPWAVHCKVQLCPAHHLSSGKRGRFNAGCRLIDAYCRADLFLCKGVEGSDLALALGLDVGTGQLATCQLAWAQQGEEPQRAPKDTQQQTARWVALTPSSPCCTIRQALGRGRASVCRPSPSSSMSPPVRKRSFQHVDVNNACVQ